MAELTVAATTVLRDDATVLVTPAHLLLTRSA
jgi:hypothetical protein